MRRSRVSGTCPESRGRSRLGTQACARVPPALGWWDFDRDPNGLLSLRGRAVCPRKRIHVFFLSILTTDVVPFEDSGRARAPRRAPTPNAAAHVAMWSWTASAAAANPMQPTYAAATPIFPPAPGAVLRVETGLKLSESPSSRGARAKLTTSRTPVSGDGSPLWHGSGRQRGIRFQFSALAIRGERGGLVMSLDSLVRLSWNAFFPSPMERIDESIWNPPSAE
jgi:hypothetical protein